MAERSQLADPARPLLARGATAARARVGVRPGRVAAYVVLIGGAALMIFPFFWMLVTSFKTLAEINLSPPTIFPHDWRPQNYITAWTKPPSSFAQYFINSAIISIVGTALQVTMAVLAAYAFAMLDFPGKNILFILFLATLMIPFEVTLIPNFVTIRHFPLLGGNDFFGNGGKGLYNTYAGMILPGAASGFSVFLLRQAFMTIPREYWEAAQIDGCSRPYFLWRVLVPLAMPAISTVALFALLARFNALLWPLVITGSEKLRPVQVGIYYFRSGEASYLNLVMAASAFVMLPAIILYAFTQRRFVEGLASTGIKG